MSDRRAQVHRHPGLFAKQSALVAQGIEHRIPNPGVARSIRAEGTNKKKAEAQKNWVFGLFFFVDL